MSENKKDRVTWIITSMGLTLWSYILALATYKIKPFWVKDNGITMTILFLIFFMIAISLLLNFILFKKVDDVDRKVKYPWLYNEENGLYKFGRDIYKGLDKRIKKFERKKKGQ